MKKPVKIILVLLLLIVLLITGRTKISDDHLKSDERLIVETHTFGAAPGLYIITDRETGVQYIARTSGNGTIAVMVDKDGNPYLANGWRDYDD